MFDFVKADKDKFAIFHTIYTAANIFDRFDWGERVDDTIDCISNADIYFVYDNKKILGGFSLKENRLNYPFIVTPFSNRIVFWNAVLDYAISKSNYNEIFLNEIPDEDKEVLMQSFGAVLRWSKRKMIRPTEQCDYVLADDFYFDSFTTSDKDEIINFIYEAHSEGYTSKIWKPDIDEIKTAIQRRFELFDQTDSLCMSNIVKVKKSHKIIGVCIAGIYPDSQAYSTSKFATIHQVVVKPEYRRKGVAKAMILKSISNASSVSPVMTLGVLVGNPSEKLYTEIGFRAGAVYSELKYMV